VSVGVGVVDYGSRVTLDCKRYFVRCLRHAYHTKREGWGLLLFFVGERVWETVCSFVCVPEIQLPLASGQAERSEVSVHVDDTVLDPTASASVRRSPCAGAPAPLSPFTPPDEDPESAAHIASITMLQSRVAGLRSFRQSLIGVFDAMHHALEFSSDEGVPSHRGSEEILTAVMKLEYSRVQFQTLLEQQFHAQAASSKRKLIISNMDAILFNCITYALSHLCDALLELAAEARQITYQYEHGH
jgi:hypothetical protein